MKTVEVTWRGHEIQHPAARITVIVFGTLTACVGMVVGTVAFIIGTPMAVMLHPLFRLAGLRGTVRQTATELHIGFDREAFRWAYGKKD